MAGDKAEMADLFAIPDFWRTSKWLEQLPPDETKPFFSPSPDALKLLKSDFIDPIISNPQDGFFRTGLLDVVPDDFISSDEPTDSAQASEDEKPGTDAASDVWMQIDQVTDQGPALRTWDSFIDGTSPDYQPAFLSEAGPATYDALLCSASDPLVMGNTDVPIVDPRAYFSSLLALSLGQESILFLKSVDGRSFRHALPRIRISGYSADVLQGLEKQCFICGTRLLELDDFVEKTYAKNSSRCGVAFASALDEVIQAARQDVVLHGQRPRSLLQLQATVKGISAVLYPFHGLTIKLQKDFSDEAVMARVFEHASSLENSGEWLREIMQEVLRRVSQPWTEFLQEWIGTKREEGVPLTKSAIGNSKSFVKVDAETYVDDFGEVAEDIDFRLDKSKMPPFMPDDVAQTIFETGRNLRFLRTSHPEHPLSRPDFVETTKPPTADWLYGWDSIVKLETEVKAYRDRLVESIDNYRSAPSTSAGPHHLAGLRHPDGASLGIFSMDEKGMEQHLLASMEKFNAPVISRTDEGVLGRIVRRRLGGESHLGEGSLDSRPHWSLVPVLSFSNIVSAQAQVINRETLRQLFRSHGLRAHLRLQRDFQLFGNGLFSSRLSHALFDPDLERADRQVGVARQGGVMGLRLGERDSWPPASSELRLALMGVLVDTYDAAHNRRRNPAMAPRNRDTSDLPGELSFAVRDMSDEEIERCMNADSLEALDFLRLSYKAPAELSFVLTPVILMQYDRIFKMLLRVLRMLYVANQLWKDVTRDGIDDDRASRRFVREAVHFVNSVASYFLDVGIALPWKAFEDKLDAVEASLDTAAAEKLESPEQLRDFHSSVLQSIMLALFLRKRQQPVLQLLEGAFSTILEFSKLTRLRRSGDSDDMEYPGRLYGEFKQQVQVFLTVCKGLTEKRSMAAGTGLDGVRIGGLGDESVIAQLLIKVESNRYYANH